MMRNKTHDKLMEENHTAFMIVVNEMKETIKGLRQDVAAKDSLLAKMHEKLLARNLPELTMYGTRPEPSYDQADYDPALDEDNAGEILDGIES